MENLTMKKSLLALAAMGAFVGAAQAQSSVSVYGIYDGGFNSTNTETSTAGVISKAITNGWIGGSAASSRLGFRGTEDLGGGRSAVFNLEVGFHAGDGTITTTTNVTSTGGVTQTPLSNQSGTGVRTSMVGIADKQLGTVTIGRRTSGIHNLILGGTGIAGNNMTGYLTSENMAGGTGYTTNTQVQINAQRMSNGLYYESPNINGLTARIDYSNDGTTTRSYTTSTATSQTANNISNFGAVLRYQGVKDLDISIGTHGVKATQGLIDAVTTPVTTPGQTATATTDTRITAGSVAYTMGGLKGEFIHARNQTTQANAQTNKVSANMIGLQYQAGAIMPFAKYGIGETQTGIAGAANADTKGMQLGAQYTMSKRTSLYAAYGSQEIKVKTSTTATLVGNTTKRTEIAAGIVHTF